MASKKKAGGCRSIRCVEKAAKVARLSIEEFFMLAANNSRVEELSARLDLEDFNKRRKNGSGDIPPYEVPWYISRLAEDLVLSSMEKQPHTYSKSKGRLHFQQQFRF